MAKTSHFVRIGKPCIRCGKDYWEIKKAFKLCQCGMKCWLRKVTEGPAIHYRYGFGENAPLDAIVTCPTQDMPYSGSFKHREITIQAETSKETVMEVP